MFKKAERQISRNRRHLRTRKKVVGTEVRPRLSVYRSEKNIYAQVIDDSKGSTLVCASTLDKEFTGNIGSNKEAAKLVGKIVGKRAVEKGISEVVFDKGGYIYHGRIKELADGAREAGLKF